MLPTYAVYCKGTSCVAPLLDIMDIPLKQSSPCKEMNPTQTHVSVVLAQGFSEQLLSVKLGHMAPNQGKAPRYTK